MDPTLNCVPESAYHTYVGSGTIRVGVWHLLRPTTGVTQFNDGNFLDDCGASASSMPYAFACGQYPWTDPITGLGWCDGVPADFDGDNEWNVGGGFFPGGQWASDPDCDYGIFPHHGSVPEIDDVAYPLLSVTGLQPAFSWGADDTRLVGGGSGKIPATDPSDQTIVGGDGVQCLTDGSITPDVDGDDWLQVCSGDATFGTTCVPPVFPNTWPSAGGDGGFTAFTLTAVTVDTGRLDWMPDPLHPGGHLHDHGGYHPSCDPFLGLANILNECHPAEIPKEAFVTLAGTITS